MWRLPITLTTLTLSLLHYTLSVEAVTFPLIARRNSEPETQRLLKRLEIVTNSRATLRNRADFSYWTNLTIGGQSFEVLIDTGSTDLWVHGHAPESRSLGVPVSVTYASGTENGVISAGTLEFDGSTVENQAYINVTDPTDGLSGIIGLGPTHSSRVRAALQSESGDPPLERIFKQDPTVPNFLTVLLSRVQDDENGPDPYNQIGQLTVGRLLDSLEGITSAPKLPVPDRIGFMNTGHWQTTLDIDGIIGPDGQRVETVSTVPGSAPSAGDETGTKRLNLVFDTGYTLPQLPAHIIHSIYGRVPGAVYIPRSGTESGYYTNIPCDYELNVTFVFGGLEYRIHPLDLTFPESRNLAAGCYSTFQTVPLHVANHTEFGPFDGILGMAFLRNVYFLVDYGDYIDGDTTQLGDPYIQLLSTTAERDAHSDFVTVRMRGVDNSARQEPLLSSAPFWGADDDVFGDGSAGPAAGNTRNSRSADQNDDRRADANSSSDKEPWYKRQWFVISAIAVGSAILLGLFSAVVACCLRRRRSSLKTESAFVPPMAGAGVYRPLRPESGYQKHQISPLPATHGAGYGDAMYKPGGYGYQEPKYQYSSA